MTCRHTELNSQVSVHHLEDTGLFIAELEVRCTQCGIPFHFLGAPTGLSMSKPTVDVPATTIHVPMLPGERSIAEVPTRITFSD
jgi:hypothetical protein